MAGTRWIRPIRRKMSVISLKCLITFECALIAITNAIVKWWPRNSGSMSSRYTETISVSISVVGNWFPMLFCWSLIRWSCINHEFNTSFDWPSISEGKFRLPHQSLWWYRLRTAIALDFRSFRLNEVIVRDIVTFQLPSVERAIADPMNFGWCQCMIAAQLARSCDAPTHCSLKRRTHFRIARNPAVCQIESQSRYRRRPAKGKVVLQN